MIKKIFFKFLSLIFLTFLFLGTLILGGKVTEAQSASDLQSKITNKGQEIEALEKEIENYKLELEIVGQEKNTLAKTIKELDLTKKKLTADIKLTEDKIIITNLKIRELSEQIFGKEDKINQNKKALASSLKSINELEANSYLEILLSENSLLESWNQAEIIKEFQNGVKFKINDLKDIKEDLEFDRGLEEKNKKELVDLKIKLADQKKIVEVNTKEKQNLLKETKNKESNYNKLLKEKLARKKAFEDELRDYEEQLKFILDPKRLPGRVLAWPLDNIYITQLFGKTVAAKRLYTSGSHSGVDFRAAVGAPVKAMASGTVLGVGDTDLACPGASFGKWVFIKHYNGLSSTYAHLSLIKANIGQIVTVGQIIGYSGNTGHSTAPHLHVTVYASGGVNVISRPSKTCGGKIYTMPVGAVNAYLDPLDFLPPYTSDMLKLDR